MAYTPPSGGSILFDYEIPYTVPAGDELDFNLWNIWNSDWCAPWNFTIGVAAGHAFLADHTDILVSLNEGALETLDEFTSDPLNVSVLLGEGSVSPFHGFLSDSTPVIVSLGGGVLETLDEYAPDHSTVTITLSEGGLLESTIFVPASMSILLTLSEPSLETLDEFQPDPVDVTVTLIAEDFEILPDLLPDPVAVTATLSGSVMRSTEAYHLPIGLRNGGVFVSWSKGGKADAVKAFPWNKPTELDPIVGVPFNEPTELNAPISISWKAMVEIDLEISSPFSDFDFLDRHFTTPYISSQYKADVTSALPWGTSSEVMDTSLSIPYNEPGGMDKHVSTPYGNYAEQLDWKLSLPYNEPGASDIHYAIPWGPKQTDDGCTYEYPPPEGGAINFTFPQYLADTPDGLDIDAYFDSMVYPLKCLYRPHKWDGRRDMPPFPPILPPYNYPPTKKVYYMFNTALVKELTTNQPIETLAVNVTTDRNSWLWQFKITVASSDCLALLRPSNGVCATLHITLNGWEFLCTVEGWAESRRYGGDAWTISGRSHSLIFGSPISSKISGTEDTGYHGGQLIENIVLGKAKPADWPDRFDNWSVNWDIYATTGGTETGFNPTGKWWVPGGTLTYSNKNEIETMQYIAGGVGAYIQTDPVSNEFIVRPMYPHQPWNWTEDNSSINYIPIIEDQFAEVSRQYKGAQQYHGIHVLGESQGGTADGTEGTSAGAIFVDVRRTECSVANATYAPMVSNQFVTSTRAALELGRSILGASGDWIIHTLRFNTLCPPGSPSMGLFPPGTMLTVLEKGVQWQCQVIGTNITAAVVDKVTVIQQVVQVEQYVGGLPNC